MTENNNEVNEMDEVIDLSPRPSVQYQDTHLPDANPYKAIQFPDANPDISERMLSFGEVSAMIQDMGLETKNRLVALEIAWKKYRRGEHWKVSDIVEDARVIEKYLTEG